MVVVHAFYLIAYIIRKMDKKFEHIYYSDDGYWRGKSAIHKLAKASGLTKEEAEVITETALVSDLPSCSKVHSKTQCKYVFIH